MEKEKNMIETTILKLNLQEGLILLGDEVVAAYNHHTKRIFVKVPYHTIKWKIPEELKGYKGVFLMTDSFGVQMWTANGYVDSLTMKLQSDDNLKDELKRRGYFTDTLWTVDDVYEVVQMINEDEDEEYSLDHDEAMEIMQKAFGGIKSDNYVNLMLEKEVQSHLKS